MKKSRRELSIDMVIDMDIFFNSQVTLFPSLTSSPVTSWRNANKTPTTGTSAVLSDSATRWNLNASYFLTGKDNIMLHPICGMLSSRAIQNIPVMLGYL